ncbi:hypothetical protein [Alteromonas sp. CYL-A6]|uniref:hypothetical protein n=1 Tax=Alteromonas nitratireducens TaxID=3390813 RepID=UPI0034B2C12C
MSKDYRYQREWDSVEDEDDFGKKDSSKRHHAVKAKQKRDLQRKEKQRRLHQEDY